MSIKKDAKFVWMDMEMSGLDPDRDQILEIATVITDQDLNVVAEGPEYIIHQPEELYQTMDSWNKEHHKKSGLWKSVIASNTSLEEATKETLEFIKKHCKKNESPLCGNSIWQDRRFLCKYMSKIDAHLNYRCIDVSSIKILAACWNGMQPPQKGEAHRALADILESIEELKLYKKKIFEK